MWDAKYASLNADPTETRSSQLIETQEDCGLKEQLDILRRLQDIDEQIDAHQEVLTRIPMELQEIARNLVTLRRDIAEIKEHIETIEKDIRQKDRDLNGEQEKIRQSEKRLLGIKNQKEYNALSKQVKLGKKVAGEIEEALLELMGQLELQRKILGRKEAEYAEFEEALTAKKAEEAALTSKAREALSALNDERALISDGVYREHLKRYQTVKNALGNALAEMQNGACTVCHMAVPPQLHIRVLKQEEIISCPSCKRILYVKPENIPEFNKIES
jgi:predicted  nucleic acid-binding Zn-ribbon protein